MQGGEGVKKSGFRWDVLFGWPQYYGTNDPLKYKNCMELLFAWTLHTKWAQLKNVPWTHMIGKMRLSAHTAGALHFCSVREIYVC